jgi:hypothetical protein
VVHARYDGAADGVLRIRGRLAGRDWEKRVRVSLPGRRAGNPALGCLWARARIADLERTQIHGERPEVVDEITRLGLRHGLVTRYTSYVAVEETMVVSGGSPRRVRVPVDMPEGVRFDGVFGLGGVRTLEGDAAPLAPPPAHALRFREASGRIEEKAEPPFPRGGDEIRASGQLERSAPAAAGMTIRISCRHSEIRAGEKVVLEVAVTNTGALPAAVPGWLLDPGVLPAVRVVDGSWRTGSIAPPADGAGGTRTIAPGETVTRTVVLDTRDGRLFRGQGVYHVILDGAPLGTADSNRVTVRIVAG